MKGACPYYHITLRLAVFIIIQRMADNWRNVGKFRPSHGRNKSDGSDGSHKISSSGKTLSLDMLEVGKVYYGRVNGVVNKDKLARMYVRFGEKGSFFERDGVVKNILYNAYLGRHFQKGDDVRVVCHSTRPLELFLQPEYVRPLLILDINGVLGERSSFDSKSPSSTRGFRTRRHYREFLAMCSAYFELAVWSCSRRNNLELSIFSEVHLLFIWSQEESTSLYPRTSVVCEAKVCSYVIQTFETPPHLNVLTLQSLPIAIIPEGAQ